MVQRGDDLLEGSLFLLELFVLVLLFNELRVFGDADILPPGLLNYFPQLLVHALILDLQVLDFGPQLIHSGLVLVFALLDVVQLGQLHRLRTVLSFTLLHQSFAIGLYL